MRFIRSLAASAAALLVAQPALAQAKPDLDPAAKLRLAPSAFGAKHAQSIFQRSFLRPIRCQVNVT